MTVESAKLNLPPWLMDDYTNGIIGFFCGELPAFNGMLFSEIWQLSDQQLEADNHAVDALFPCLDNVKNPGLVALLKIRHEDYLG